MSTSVPVALASAMRTMPAPAMPGVIDALLLVTGASSSVVFRDLLRILELQEIIELFEAFKAAALHLLLLSEDASDVLDELVRAVCLPLLSTDSTKGSRLFAEAIAIKCNWDYALATLVPSCSRAMSAALDGKEAVVNGAQVVLSLPATCQVVSQLLLVASDVMVNDFCASMMDQFWSPCLRLLSESMDDSLRSLVLQTLLPSLLRACKLCQLKSGLDNVWQCCQVLLSSNKSQRRDAYRILSMIDDFGDLGIREPQIWDELRAGLVDGDSLTRKRALHVLKHFLKSVEVLMGNNSTAESVEASRKNGSKREQWANEEAKSLGVESWSSEVLLMSECQQWTSFLLLYDTLEEYGIHLVEAAWEKQIIALVQSVSIEEKTLVKRLDSPWILLLFERGFKHGNPQVRRHVFQSFFKIEWGTKISISREFVLGPLLCALNDPVHHKDFGVNGIYISNTGKLANQFFRFFTSSMNFNTRVNFVINFCDTMIKEPLCRAGLMTLTSCVEVVAATGFDNALLHDSCESTRLLDSLRFIVESSKHHFNPRYRCQVCSYALKALSSLFSITELDFGLLSIFLGSFPREFLASAGPLRSSFDHWLKHSGEKGPEHIFNGLQSQLVAFLKCPDSKEQSYTITEGDIDSWREIADRWARVLFIGVHTEQHQAELLLLLEQYAADIYGRVYMPVTVPEKVLLVLQSLIREWAISATGSFLQARLTNLFRNIMDELVPYAEKSAVALWEFELDSSIQLAAASGRLGGPSLRRLPPRAALVVVKAVLAVETLAECSVWISVNDPRGLQDSTGKFLWKISWKLLEAYNVQEDLRGEFQLAGLEAVASLCKALPVANNKRMIHNATEEGLAESCSDPALFVDNLVAKLLKAFEDTKVRLTRSRCAVLSRHKWSCLDGFLSLKNLGDDIKIMSAISELTLLRIMQDALESIASAGEDYVIPIFRCVRWLFHWGLLDLQEDPHQVVWELVRSGWTCIADCNKRKVALFAAFLSSFFHPRLFPIADMHNTNDNEEGPLKWLLGRLIELGSRSPRTMRLTALHVSGLWLKFPETTTFYMKEIQFMCLYGGEAIDEEFDGEIFDKEPSSREFSALIKSSDPELQEAFSNSEMFVRVAIAIMMDKFAQLVEKGATHSYELRISIPAVLNCGRSLLFQLLNAAVHDLDLAKELYKKNSALHRRKVRLWQMLCILTRFVDESMLEDVILRLEQCVYRNNMPSVRQYIEIFAVQLYLRFPALVKEHLARRLSDVNMKTQALSSYVYIAANVLRFISPEHKEAVLQHLLPVVLPHMTSHHHNLRTFTQVLFFHVFSIYRNNPVLSENLGLSCLTKISSYLEMNTDCTRLRESVDQFLFKLEPSAASKPRGLFCNTADDGTKILEDRPFECVPVAVLDKVAELLKETREELRGSMAANAVYLNFGDEKIDDKIETNRGDYQKKVIPYKDKTEDAEARLTDVEYEDSLLFSLIDKKGRELAKAYEGRQDLIVVASLVERIPNLAGLARTCEVFKASALTVADKKILEDRQFKLISVTAEQWVPILEVKEGALIRYLERMKDEGYAVLGLEQTANSVAVNNYSFPSRVVLVLGREKDGIPVNLIQTLDACLEIPQLGMIRSLNVHVSGAIAVWEYTKQHLQGGPGL
ncbi:uncharacterized protein LOC9630109 isoform X1 [Selaginella moellendorffii]|uniref:uncharacterized protein LOC9630109 isoform X1 n=1 Tax=Selaginella moellendorffii TaxID=88036 RepID=UPI000D1CA229|nr:uncharacterized protein LOC9630109 isoform X1 [Selaginella moellendorffii]XP_024539047.1 uncharacterized protein LOC9630109 isoform X1 [Selaginella moellendorffii]|eukprot:XP_002961961.2 uncharacterized protein LOC9630109 isoform X1 [Selaginella moellendorffii]